ncbi:MAG: ATP-dependent Clp protease adaptor protein ClpS, partial [uncultured Nocardioidaceae bacterium]
ACRVRAVRARRPHCSRPALADGGLERPGQPDVVRHLRLPAVLRLLQEEGREEDARGPPGRPVDRVVRESRGDGAGRAGDARVRPLGDPGEVRWL